MLGSFSRPFVGTDVKLPFTASSPFGNCAGTESNPFSLDALAIFIFRVLHRVNHPVIMITTFRLGGPLPPFLEKLNLITIFTFASSREILTSHLEMLVLCC